MKKSLLVLLAASVLPISVGAQQLTSGDVDFPASDQLPTYVEQWNGGGGTLIVNGKEWEDYEFFTSRVKPRTRVTATGTNIHDFGSKAGRRSLWWVPIDDPGCQAIPAGRFNYEAFSVWSYLDYYGVFTAPYGWVTGSMADIAHKNGVATAGQASMPWAGFSGSNWETCMTAMANKYSSQEGVEKLGKFLHYFGVDGLGYNSESSGWQSIIDRIRQMHNGLMVYMKDRNPLFENIWYDGTNDSGILQFDSFLYGKTQLYEGSSIFSNYNWNRPSSMAQAVTRANGVTGANGEVRGPWWNYAGMNQQGGEPKTGETYPVLKQYDWSMGWWGAHSNNMFWEGRGGHGTSDEAVLAGYLAECERFFGNGPRNPAISKPITTVRAHRANEEFFGVSAFINERSPLTHNIGSEPFYTFFNLGNGRYFNWKGERVSDAPWGSIAVQDFLPTWRFWTSPEWLQKEVTEGTTNLKVGFTYDDAYFGGSCLKVEGTTAKEYLHLFKSSFSGLGSKTITFRYKVLEGKADLRLMMTSVNNPAVESNNATWKNLQVFTADECEELENQSYREGADGWQVATFKISAPMASNTNMPGGLGAIGLEFKNAEGLKLLIGELSIMGNQTAAPVAPQIVSSKVLRNVSTGVDGKIIWTMDNDVARMNGTPKYNSDVNTSMFKVYSREEGSEDVHFLGVTTSWAALAYRAPNTDESKKIQFGVSAVSMDTKTESAITWGQLLSKGQYTVSEEVALDKLTIKPGEAFKAYFVDTKHEPVTWRIADQEGNTIAEAEGIEINMPNGIAEWGGYDLYVGEKLYGFFIQISEEKVGALPEIKTIANETGELAGDETVTINLTDQPTLSYTGRKADGSASRGVDLNSTYWGTNVGDLGIQAYESFSVSYWLKIKELPSQTFMMFNVSSMGDGWPYNRWGWMWSNATSDGQIFASYRNVRTPESEGGLQYTFPETRLQPGVWSHICYISEYTADGQFRHQLYINGVKQKSTVFAKIGGSYRDSGGVELKSYIDENGQEHGTNSGDMYIDGQVLAVSAADWLYVGGQAHGGACVDGAIDDFQVWKKALTADEVRQAMSGFSADAELPAGLLADWDLESQPTEDGYFFARGEKAGTKACSHIYAHENDNPEAPSTYIPQAAVFTQGCPFLEGTAYPVVTTASWSDNVDRRTKFEKTSEGTEDLAGAAKVTFNKEGDHTVTLKLENTYGSDSRTFPVYHVGPASIDGVAADEAGVKTYTVDRTLFLEFAEAGVYEVQVYNTAGMLVGSEELNAAAGQSARVDLGASGVYLVKVVKNGQALRTLKVMSK